MRVREKIAEMKLDCKELLLRRKLAKLKVDCWRLKVRRKLSLKREVKLDYSGS